MIVCRTIEEFRHHGAKAPRPLGLVPTMGFLHAGHLALITQSIAENSTTAATIFVNPTQFNSQEDLAQYPHDEPSDLKLLEDAGVALVFIPSTDEIYPPRFQTYVTVEKLAAPLEGASRPGHFRGVATVVAKLLNICDPDRAYFGQKDAQQVAVIKQMVSDLNFSVQVKVHPTVRERDGLALSSRNARLLPQEREVASVLHKALAIGQDAIREGESDPATVVQKMQAVIAAEPLATLDYLSITDALTLEDLTMPPAPNQKILISGAIYIGKVRLIDNVVLNR